MGLGIRGIFLSTTGCDQLEHASSQSSPRPSVASETRTHPIGRFEKIQNFRVDVALDTQTGQLCKTWPWQSTNRNSVDPYETLPTCDVLHKDFPTVEKLEPQTAGVRTGTDNSSRKRVFWGLEPPTVPFGKNESGKYRTDT